MGIFDIFKPKDPNFRKEKVRKLNNQRKLIKIARDDKEDRYVRMIAIGKINDYSALNEIINNNKDDYGLCNAAKDRQRTLSNSPKYNSHLSHGGTKPKWSEDEVRRMRQEFD